MKKKLIAGAAAALLLALAGCSTAGGSNASGPAPKDLKASITYGFWNGQEKAVEKIVDGFHQEYPNIKVTTEITPYAQYFTKLQTQASSNTLPDVFWLNMPNFKLYADNGQLAPIDPLIDSKQIALSNYPSDITKFFSANGKQYGVPKDVDTTAMWIDKKLFAEAGVPLPKDGWTWSDYEADAKTITDKLGPQGIYGTVFELAGQTTWYNTIFEAGGYVISPDGKKSGWDLPATRKGIQIWADLIKNGDAPTVQQVTDTMGYQWFTAGKAAMYPMIAGASIGIMQQAPNKADLTVVPMPKDKIAANVGHSITNVVAAKSKNLQAAQAFQAYLSGKDAALILAKTGIALPAYKGTSQPFVDSDPEFDLQVFVDAVADAKPYPASKNTAVWATPEATLIPQALSGQITVADATTQLADKMNAALAKEK